MAWSIGLHLGEHFSEVVAQFNGEAVSPDGPGRLVKKRFFTPQMAPEAGLSQFLTENSIQKIDRAQLATSWPQRIIEARHGSSIAVLTTSGFESWLELTQPLKTQFFSPHPERPTPLFDSEFVFGVNERVNAQGHIEKLLEETELEFLCSKLELNQIKNIAVCFLHSYKNSTNENLARKYLEAKGYQVYISSQWAPSPGPVPDHSQNEKTRFWQTIRNAYCRPLFAERLQKISDLLTPLLSDPSQLKMGKDDLSQSISGLTAPLADSNSVTDFITQKFAPATPLLYCGLEEFVLLDGSRRKSTPISNEKLRLQPLTTLGRTFLSPISFRPETASYDPGPITFGRGHTPTLFDLVVSAKDFVPPMGAAEKVTDRGRNRLNEHMVAYARSSSDKMNVPADQLIKALLQMAGEILRDDIRNKLVTQNAAKNVIELRIAGPLAAIIAPLLRAPLFKVTALDDEFLAAKALLLSAGGVA